jgi:large subunit ribosomal protein L10
MPNAEKLEKVAALKERIEGSDALLLAEYRGLSVHDATELRRSLSEQARFAVVKNTLMQRAAGEAGIQELEALLTGPTAVAFVRGDVVAAAKKVADAAKRFPALVLKGAYLDGKVLGATEAQSLASLESREAMLSKVAGLMKTEMSRAASMFQALQSRFVGVLEAYKDKLPAPEAEAASAAPEPQAAEESESPEPGSGLGSPTEVEASTEAAPAEAAGGSSPPETEPSTTATGDASPGGAAGADAAAEDESTATSGEEG